VRGLDRWVYYIEGLMLKGSKKLSTQKLF